MTTQTAWAYFTVQQFISKHTAFTTGGLRFLIFDEHQNGLAESGAIVRIGRRILIDEAKFFGWVQSHNKRGHNSMGRLDTTGATNTGSISKLLPFDYTSTLKTLLIKISEWLYCLGVSL